MEKVFRFRVFASSPGDVNDEKDALQDAVENINQIDGEQLGYMLKVVDWRSDIVPKIGEPPQDVVDAQLPQYDIYLGIMASRYGGGGTGKEFEDAFKRYQQSKPKQPWPHILFFFRDDVPAPKESKALAAYAKVVEFREKLQEIGIIGTYTGVRGTDRSFYDQVHGDLRKIVHQWINRQKGDINSEADPRGYLDALSKASRFIDIRGIGTDVIKHETELEIDKIYMTLTATGAAQSERASVADANSDEVDEPMMRSRRSLSLDEVIKRQGRIVLTGDPGSGKTTFLRRLAFFLCELNLGRSTTARDLEEELRSHPFPILVRISSFSNYLSRQQAPLERPTAEPTPQDPDTFLWLPHYLAQMSQDNRTGLGVEYFNQQLEAGRCTVLMDGLDEAGDEELRERVVRILEQATQRYEHCRFIVTSRPGAYRDRTVLSGFERFQIDALSDDSISDYLAKWCRSIKQIAQSNDSQRYLDELKKALQATDIRRLARNPVMLQALAVVHYNIGTMPEKRAHLYKAIIEWLVRSRRQRRPADGSEHDPIKGEDLIERFRKLALAMQLHPQGRQAEVSRQWAASVLLLPNVATDQWENDLPIDNSQATRKDVNGADLRRMERFLQQEELLSGIIVQRNGQLAFAHLTFQEYLAAVAIEGEVEHTRQQVLFGKLQARLFKPEWHEMLLLLGGLLRERGVAPIDQFIGTLLQTVSGKGQATLAQKASCVGLVGAMVRDLSPWKYQVKLDPFYALSAEVMAIFDRERASEVSVEERVQAADALGQANEQLVDLNEPGNWVSFPAESFWMGAQKNNDHDRNYDPEARERESPVHLVELDAFALSKHPVTVVEFERFMNDQGYDRSEFWTQGGFGEYQAPDNWDLQMPYRTRPVVGVSWYEAAAFCAWRGGSLPTEAQWERAARGTAGRRYPWGPENADVDRLNYDGNLGHPTPVGIFPLGSSPEGMVDMAGNVWEWCRDWFADNYGNESKVVNPTGTPEGVGRVLRGGSWYDSAAFCRAAICIWNDPSNRDNVVGFRVARRSV